MFDNLKLVKEEESVCELLFPLIKSHVYILKKELLSRCSINNSFMCVIKAAHCSGLCLIPTVAASLLHIITVITTVRRQEVEL